MYLGYKLPSTTTHWALSEVFADESLAGRADKIASRGQSVLAKVRSDIIFGTVAEFAVSDFLKAQGFTCTEPDTTFM